MNIDIETLVNNTVIVLGQQNLNASSKRVRSILTSFIQGCFEHFNKNPPFPPVSEINRRAIANVVDVIRTKSLEKQQQEHDQIQLPQYNQKFEEAQQRSSNSLKESVEFMNQHHNQPRYPSEVSKYNKPIQELPKNIELPKMEILDDNIDEENTFLKKLEELEITRNTLNTTTPAPSPIPSQNIQPSAPQQQSITPQIIAAPTVIYVPTKAKLSDLKQIIINSYDRDWDYSANRSIFVWAGPIPSGESIKLGFSGIFLPKIVATNNAIIIIEIEGAGGQKQTVLCSLSLQGVLWDTWNIIRTPDSKNCDLKHMACPWTIKLYDIYNELLNLGSDSQIINNVDVLMNSNAVVEFNSETDLENNNIFIIKKGNINYGKYKIVNKLDHRYQIQSINNNKNYNELQGGIICNLNKQIIMVIEIKKNEIKPTTNI